jgi:hypothetical protein
MKLDAILWAEILSGPMIWFANLEANFALAPLACSGHSKGSLYLVSVISLALVALIAVLSWSQRRSLERESAGPAVVAVGRRRAMALGSMGLNSLCFVVILAQTIPNLMFRGCE